MALVVTAGRRSAAVLSTFVGGMTVCPLRNAQLIQGIGIIIGKEEPQVLSGILHCEHPKQRRPIPILRINRDSVQLTPASYLLPVQIQFHHVVVNLVGARIESGSNGLTVGTEGTFNGRP